MLARRVTQSSAPFDRREDVGFVEHHLFVAAVGSYTSPPLSSEPNPIVARPVTARCDAKRETERRADARIGPE